MRVPLRELNRTIAANLTHARRLRGMTQEEVADALEPYTGKRVTKATISAAERSVAAPAERVRKFTVDDVVAYSQVFDLPFQFFLLPVPTSRRPNAGPPSPEHLRHVGGPHWSLTDRIHELSREPDFAAQFSALLDRQEEAFGAQRGDRELEIRLKRAAKERDAEHQTRARDLAPAVIALAEAGFAEYEIAKRLQLDSPSVGRILSDHRVQHGFAVTEALRAPKKGQS